MVRRLLPILGITFVDIIGFSMLLPILPYFVTHFGASPFVVGLLFATFSLCQLISGPVWGHISDRAGRKTVLIVSQIGATIGWAILAFSPNLLWVFIARIIEGTSGGNIGITQAYVADLVAPKERSRAFGLISATFGAGMVFGPVGGGLLFARFGYAAPFLAAAALQLLTLLLTIVFVPESRVKPNENEPHVGLRDFVATFRNVRVSRVLWQKIAFSLALYGWFGVQALYLKAQLHYTVMDTTLLFAAFAVSNVIVTGFLIGRIATRIGDRAMSSIGLVVLLFSFAIMPFVHNTAMVAAMVVTFAFGMGLASTGITALLSNAASDRDQGTVLSVGSSLDSVSGIFAPPTSTWLLTRYGSAYAGLESLALAFVALIVGLILGRTDSNFAAPHDAPTTAEYGEMIEANIRL